MRCKCGVGNVDYSADPRGELCKDCIISVRECFIDTWTENINDLFRREYTDDEEDES